MTAQRTEEAAARVEATIHRINNHWWNKRSRPEAPDLRTLLDALKPSLDHISKLEGERDRLREALIDWQNSWLCPATDFETQVARLLSVTFAALNGSPPSENKGKNDG